MGWNTWMASVWNDLLAGKHVRVPRALPHPVWSGFEVPPIAEPVGQKADWVLSLTDGSRLHVHEFSNGALVAHRDGTDPKRGPLHAVWHWATESTSGRLTLGVAAIIGIAALVDRD